MSKGTGTGRIQMDKMPKSLIGKQPRDYTPKEAAIVVEAFAKLSLSQLRKRQNIQNVQQREAGIHRNPDSDLNVEVMRRIVIEAIILKEFTSKE